MRGRERERESEGVKRPREIRERGKERAREIHRGTLTQSCLNGFTAPVYSQMHRPALNPAAAQPDKREASTLGQRRIVTDDITVYELISS